MIIQTGKPLTDLRSFDLFDAGYRLMISRSLITEEEDDIVRQVDKHLSDAGYESSTGMPAITQWLAPANAADIGASPPEPKDE